MFDLPSDFCEETSFLEDLDSISSCVKSVASCQSPVSLDFPMIDDDLTAWLSCLQEVSASESCLSKLPKKVRRRKRRLPFPRVFKEDIRRKYPMMFVNVVNSCDPQLMCEFFRKFCRPECELYNCLIHPQTREKIQMFSHSGLSEMLPFAHVKVVTAAPDFVMQLQHAYIKRSVSFRGSIVTFQVRAKASSLFHFYDDANCHDQLALSTRAFLDALMARYHTKDRSFNPFELIGTMTMHMDDEHRLERLEMSADFCLCGAFPV
eukprot:gene27221-32888_t